MSRLFDWSDFVALSGDHYTADFQGHTIDFVRNNWVHFLSLRIDGVEVAKQSCHFPRRILLTATLECGGKQHEVVARSIPRNFFWADDTIEVDGDELPLMKIK